MVFSISKSQNEITNFIYGESQNLINDTEIAIEGYMSPIGKWFGTGLNAGWYNLSQNRTSFQALILLPDFM